MAHRVAITGAAGTIGRALCAVLDARGYALHLVDRAGAQALADDLGATAWEGTARDATQARDALGDAPLHGLVHLAGIMEDDPTLGDAPEVWTRAIDDNLRNAYDFATAAGALMPTGSSGRMVFASSLAFRRGAVDAVAYSAAKGGLVGVTRALARRFRDRATVNAVAPGIIESPMAAPVIARRRDVLLREIPLGRFGAPREVATVIAFLIGEDSAYMTGQCLNIDGGQIMT